MVEIDLSVTSAHSLARTLATVRVWSDSAQVLAAAVSQGRGLTSAADLYDVFSVMREGFASLALLVNSAEKYVIAEVEAARVGVSGTAALTADTVIGGATTALGQMREAAAFFYTASITAQATFTHITPTATARRLQENRAQELGKWAGTALGR